MFCETVVLLSKGAKDPVDLCSARKNIVKYGKKDIPEL